MTSLTSPRPDSVFSVQDTETLLRQENEQLQSRVRILEQADEQRRSTVCIIEQERDAARKEALTFLGAGARHTREKRAWEDEKAELQKQLDGKDKELTQVNGELSSKRRQLREQQKLPAPQAISYQSTTALGGDSTQAQLETVQAQLAQLQLDYNRLQNLHAGTGCEDLQRVCVEKVAEARELQQAAEAEVEGYCHLDEELRLSEAQVSTSNKKLCEALTEIRGKDVEINNLHGLVRSLQRERAALQNQLPVCEVGYDSEIDNLEQELAAVSVTDSDLGSSTEMSIIEAYDVPVLSKLVLSNVFALDIEPQAPASLTKASKAQLAISNIESISIIPQSQLPCVPVAANITINLCLADRKNWTFMQRVKSVISANAKLDIHGPDSLVAEFVNGMGRAQVDHAHWQKIALNSLEEMEELRRRPLCNMPGHRSLADELAAKDLQLQMQADLVAHWQKESEHCHASVPDAVAALHEKLEKGMCVCEAGPKSSLGCSSIFVTLKS